MFYVSSGTYITTVVKFELSKSAPLLEPSVKTYELIQKKVIIDGTDIKQKMIDDSDFLILLYLFHHERTRKHSRYTKYFYKRLSSYHCRISGRKITRDSPLQQKASTWRKLFKSHNDSPLTAKRVDGSQFNTTKFVTKTEIYQHMCLAHPVSDAKVVVQWSML